MELLIAILLALGVNISPGKTAMEIQNENVNQYFHAQTIIDTNAYHIDENTGIVILEDGAGD